MNRLKKIVLASLCGVCLAPAAQATVMTFDGSATSWNTVYDSATVDVVFQSNKYFWDTGYNNLSNVAYGDRSVPMVIDFLAKGGSTVTLNSFDLGNYLGNGGLTGYVVYDLADTVTPLVALNNLAVAYATNAHSSFTVGLSSTTGFRLSLGPDMYNIAVDNIDFTAAVAAVPEPGTVLLVGLALVGLMAGRQKKVQSSAA